MTAILAYHDGKRGYMAADRRESMDATIISDCAIKIVRVGPWLIGNAGYGLMLQLIKENTETLAACASALLLAREFRRLRIAEGWGGKASDDGQGPMVSTGGNLVVNPQGAWGIFGDGVVCQVTHPQGLGSGGDYAQGAMEAFIRAGVPTLDALRQSIEVACLYDRGSGGQPQIEVAE